MTSATTKIVLSLLYDNHGCLEFRRLEELMKKSFTIAESVLRTVLFDDTIIAIKEGKEEPSGPLQICPDSLIVAKTGLRLCKKKAEECEQCEGLHLCMYHVCGGCEFGLKCKNSHSLTLPHNATVLRKYNLEALPEKQLFQLLIQNDPSLFPEICSYYNYGKGLHGSCKYTTTCNKIHVCKHHFQGDCTFGSTCKRNHKLDEQTLKFFRGVSEENMKNLFKIYRNKFIILDQEKGPAAAVVRVPSPQFSQNKPITTSQAIKKEICLFHLLKKCNFKAEKCAHVHWCLPYKWEVLDEDNVTWKDLDINERIEKTYSDPAQDSCSMEEVAAAPRKLYLQMSRQSSVFEQSVDFITMTSEGSPVRRLSTVSSVLKPPNYLFTTQWVWYWKDDNGKWLEFGKSDDDTPATVTTQTLEKEYLADREAEISFSAGQQDYILRFKDTAGTQRMYQIDTRSKTRREVRRRPRFFSPKDVESQPSTLSQGSTSSTAGNVPSSWDKKFLPSYGYKMVSLSHSAQEYRMIEKLFMNSMSQSTITSIERIQNPSLWKLFQCQKEQMNARNGGKPANMMHLFHGTSEEQVEDICEQNFDWRMCGLHNTLYGKGSYFAKEASLSDKYSRASGTKVMFVALVLVGDYTQGHSSFVRPPAKEGSTALYDSCVNRDRNPSIYVIFDKLQIYPEYLIKYS
ncbi:protein mono-ADP-ribosyltransferase PARP12 [Gouania willdenowi]|nr:protein mono-ADP-ribosyltransferase PARP12-like [Gouania willdenowi]